MQKLQIIRNDILNGKLMRSIVKISVNHKIPTVPTSTNNLCFEIVCIIYVHTLAQTIFTDNNHKMFVKSK